MSVTLKNLTNRMQTVLLDHDSAARGKVTFKQAVDDRKSGGSATKRVQLDVLQSVSIPAGSARHNLPDYVALCADVRRQEKLGWVQVLKVSPPAPAPVKAAEHKTPKAPEIPEESSPEDSGSASQPEQNQSGRRTPPATRKRKG